MMKNRHWDVRANVTFLSSGSGGRAGPTTPSRFGCLMQVGRRFFDVRLDLSEIGPISPGQSAFVPISFLDPDFAGQYCKVGATFKLKETRIIGSGTITESCLLTPAESTVRPGLW